MGFSVYGRIGGQNGNNVQNNYGQNTYCPKVLATRSYLNSGRSSGVYCANNSYGGAQPYNPKSTTLRKKDNKNLKTALIIAGTAATVFLCRGKIETGLTAIKNGAKKTFGPTIEKISKKTVGEICSAPGKAVNNAGTAIKGLGKKIATPFKKIANFVATKFPKK